MIYHGTYIRKVQDLPVLGKSTFLDITAHEYTCSHKECNAKTIVEDFDGFLCYYSRMTERLADFICMLALETSCEACARICKTMGIHTSGDSIIRLLIKRYEKQPKSRCGSVIGVDDFSYKKRHTNAFQPAMLGGYPSNLELLIEKQQSGQLHITPVLIMTGGEYLSDALRDKLAKAFGCYVQTSYSCTERGTIACECTEQHFHINDDWLIVEPVDKDNRLVPDGVQADKILLTNLFNFTQPFIRYEVTDRVVLHDEPCKCGNLSPWLTLEGRADEVVSFLQNGIEMKLAPLAIYAILKEVHELRRFQFVARSNHHVELRLEPEEGITTQEAFGKAKAALENFFSIHGLTNVDVALSDEKPKQDAGSGKFKQIISTLLNQHQTA